MASRAFKDINLSFKRHPVTNDVVVIRDEDAIKRSVDMNVGSGNTANYEFTVEDEPELG